MVGAIHNDDRVIIIDGLDHVENYNPNQMDDYINFIHKLENSKTVVLSRPLRRNVPWTKITLSDWGFDETRIYLEMAYDIYDYRIQSQIFRVSGGYPIIVY